MAQPNHPTVSAIVPVHNGGEPFQKCFKQLSRTDPPPDEMIAVADGATDDSAQVAERFGAQVIRLATRGGPARARNHGARAAKGDILLFIDGDVVVSSDVVDKVTAFFRKDPDLAAVFGSYDDEPDATNFLSQYKNLLHHYVHQTGNEDASTFWAGCGAVRRDIFLAFDGFDETYRYPSIEDIELGHRLKQAGHKILLSKSLQVKHLKRWGALSLLQSDVLYRAAPWTELIMRRGGLASDLNLKVSSRLSAALIWLLAFCLVAGWWRTGLYAVAAAIVLALLTLNAPLYLFFYRKRGLGFMLQAVPWHWLYYFYSAAVFALVAGLYLFRTALRRAARLNKTVLPLGRS